MDNKNNYIFISYAHKDSAEVIPIIDSLENKGFNIWYDSGIEAGTEWPEFIAEKLMGSKVVIAFISENSVNSPNCRREINFAIKYLKDLLVIYLEDIELTPGMQLQLDSLQAMFRNRSRSTENFIETLSRAAVLQSCLTLPAPVQMHKAPEEVETPIKEEVTDENLKQEVKEVESLSEEVDITDNDLPAEEEKVKEATVESASSSEIENTDSIRQETDEEMKESSEAEDEAEENDEGFIVFKELKKFPQDAFSPYRITFRRQLKPKQFKNAMSHIADKANPKNVLAIIDTTILGNGKEGFVFTKDRMYSLRLKHKFSVKYNAIQSVSGDESYMYITFIDGTTCKTHIYEERIVELLNNIASELKKYNNKIVEISPVVSAINDTNKISDNRFVFGIQLTKAQKTNAIESFAKGIKSEDIIAMHDISFYNTGKKGWLVTEKALYSHEIKSSNPIIFEELESVLFVDGNLILKFKAAEPQQIYIGTYYKHIYDFLDILINKK